MIRGHRSLDAQLVGANGSLDEGERGAERLESVIIESAVVLMRFVISGSVVVVVEDYECFLSYECVEVEKATPEDASARRASAEFVVWLCASSAIGNGGRSDLT